MPGPDPLLLAVDGDSLVHRAHHGLAADGDRDAAGRPVWALRGLISLIASAAARLTPDALVVGFDCRAHSVRKADYPGYKAQRADKSAALQAQLETAPALLADAGVTVVVARGFEADDVLASAAALARRSGWRAVLATSDRDAFALIDDRTSVLRLVNGGVEASPVLTPAALAAAYGVTPAQYRDYAALRGDTSDNLPGVLGIGRTIAARILAALGSLDDAYAALDGGRDEEVGAAGGAGCVAALADPAAREAVLRNRRLMAMRPDLELPELAAMRLPLDPRRVRSALLAQGIRLGPSLWALLGEPPPAWLGLGGYDSAPRHLPGADGPRGWRAVLPPLGAGLDPAPPAPPARPARPRPAARGRGAPRPVPVGQLTLF